MIPKKLDDIIYSDIELLIENEVRESRVIEYKLQLPHDGESEKIPFLAGVSAFANTIGGDLIIGVSCTDGKPTTAQGIKIENIDKEILRLENTIRTGIEPRLTDFSIKQIKLQNGNSIILIRVKKSWNSPHRISFKDHSKFYGRNSAGKYPLDVTELKMAFNASENISSRIRSFKNDRLSDIQTNYELPVILCDGGKLVIHIIPLSAFTNQRQNIIPELTGPANIRPIDASGWTHKHNIDGIVTYSGGGGNHSHTYWQLYRSGIIESVVVIDFSQNDHPILPSKYFEKEIVQSVSQYLKIYTQVDIEPPIYVIISLLGMQDYQLAIKDRKSAQTLDRKKVSFPETVIEEIGVDLYTVFRPVFDMIWNAFGYKCCFDYDEYGNWIE